MTDAKTTPEAMARLMIEMHGDGADKAIIKAMVDSETPEAFDDWAAIYDAFVEIKKQERKL